MTSGDAMSPSQRPQASPSTPRWYLDTEFIDDGRTIDLISIGLACSDGRTYYAVSTEFDEARAQKSPWLLEHVLSQLPFRRDRPEWKSRAEIKNDLVSLLVPAANKPKPLLWAYFADYDWVAFCQLFGAMVDLPEGLPKYCLDIKQEMVRLGIERGTETWGYLPVQDPRSAHHALADALHDKAMHEAIIRMEHGPDHPYLTHAR